jgi:hypothetical protein
VLGKITVVKTTFVRYFLASNVYGVLYLFYLLLAFYTPKHTQYMKSNINMGGQRSLNAALHDPATQDHRQGAQYNNNCTIITGIKNKNTSK